MAGWGWWYGVVVDGEVLGHDNKTRCLGVMPRLHWHIIFRTKVPRTDLSMCQTLRLVGCKYQDQEGGWDISGCHTIVCPCISLLFFLFFRLNGSTRS